jgi:RimJ/RimL family protein N-acetyltransferase
MNALHPETGGGEMDAQRRSIRRLLTPTDPADAMTAYYATTYDRRRVRLTLYRSSAGRVDGFIAVCQTGRDLFVPLVVMRTLGEALADLLHQALQPGRPYTIVTAPALRDVIQEAMLLEWQRINVVHVLDPSAYRPVINVMVQPGESPFRFDIKTGGQVVSTAGVNWQSSRLAEMYVYTDPHSQGRGWGRAVGAACVRELLRARLLPLYTVSEDNVASLRLARSLGFRDSGAREFECQGRLRS